LKTWSINLTVSLVVLIDIAPVTGDLLDPNASGYDMNVMLDGSLVRVIRT